jgi:hypothetical protein
MKKFLTNLYLFCASITVIIIVLIVYFFANDKSKTKEEIKNNKVQFFKTIGWIDWGHALPDGPQKLIDELASNKSDTVTYFQDMKKIIAGQKVTIRLTSTYYVHPILRNSPGVACFIFMDVTTDFEGLQGRWPYKPICSICIGDINGDKIALLRALKIPVDYQGVLGTPENTTSALDHFSKYGNEENQHSTLDKFLPQQMKVRKISSKIEYILEQTVNPPKTSYIRRVF